MKDTTFYERDYYKLPVPGGFMLFYIPKALAEGQELEPATAKDQLKALLHQTAKFRKVTNV